MPGNSKLSFIVAGGFFILFLLFVVLNPNLDNLTGAVIADTFLGNLSDCNLTTYTYDTKLFQKDIKYFFNVTGKESGDCILFTKITEYPSNTSYVNKNMTCKINDNNLDKITKDQNTFDDYLEDNTFKSGTTDCSGKLKDIIYAGYLDYSKEGIFNFENFGMINFTIDKDGNMTVVDTDIEFTKGQYIWCIVNYSASKGNLSISFYGPKDKTGSSDKEFNNVAYNLADLESDNPEGGICATDVNGVCGAMYNVENVKLGDWKCVAEYKSSTKTELKVSEVSAIMISIPPVQIKDVPNFNVTEKGSYSKVEINLEMKNYFKDKDSDDLQYWLEGGKYIDAELKNGWLDIGVTPGFQGMETVYLKVSDESSSINSNNFTIKVGTGNSIPQTEATTNLPNGSCVPSWECGPWSSCVGGKQSKICVDKNNCGVDTNKPFEIQDCVVSTIDASGGKSNTIIGTMKSAPISTGAWILFFLGIGIFIAGLVIFFVMHKKKEGITKEIKGSSSAQPSFEEESVSEAEKRITFNTTNQKILSDSELESEITKRIIEGKDVNIIINELVNIGQDPKNVANKVNLIKAKNIVKMKLSQGFTEDKIRESFSLKGWKKEQIDELFK